MTLLSPLPALLLTLLALLCMAALLKWEGRPVPEQGRFATIDGLRGYLAFFVFLHHSSIWYNYARTGVWQVPPSHLYTQFGEASVSLFFMITSFLFYNKLLESRHKRFDWTGFFVGRLFRLTPLYLWAMTVLFIIVAVLSHGVLYDSAKYTIKCMLEWLSFTVIDAPDINRIPTKVIVAGVTWSLPYEWAFYLALPLLALTTGQRVRLPLLVVGAAAVGLGAYLHMQFHMVLVFAGGVLGAILAHSPAFREFAKRPLASVIAAIALLALGYFSSAYGTPQVLLLAVAFCLIANGANLFGVLTAHVSRRFGELAYSIYLLHGIVLFVALNFVVGKPAVALMQPTQYWMTIAACVPALLALATLTFRFIEEPGIGMTRTVLALRKPRPAPHPG